MKKKKTAMKLTNYCETRKSIITIDINGQLQRRLMMIIALLQTYLLGHARKKHHYYHVVN